MSRRTGLVQTLRAEDDPDKWPVCSSGRSGKLDSTFTACLPKRDLEADTLKAKDECAHFPIDKADE
jgi:hypothetical protein